MFERVTSGVACLAVILIWYPCLTLLLGFGPSFPDDFGLAFNSMAEHLLAGRFDVDPDAIGAEAFDIDGRAVSYFGIFCALVRIPLVLLPGFARTDVTWWSCLVAMGIGTWFQVRAVQLVWPSRDGAWTRRDWLAWGLLLSVLLGGQHVQFLRPSIFQEILNWADAEAMAFVFLTLRGLTTERGFDGRTLCALALCAGLALLTRVTFGIGLYAALGLLLLARGRPRTWAGPVGVLIVFAVAQGIVNIGRWGNPMVFADFTRYGLSMDAAPERLGRLAAYGAFNVVRIPLTLEYYFLPVWIWIRTDGHVLFAETQAALMDSMELPPSSFFLTDPLLLVLAVSGVWSARNWIRAGTLLGLAIPPVLMLCAISAAHRYRMEFYPILFLAALIGLGARSWGARATPRFRAWIIVCTVLGIVVAHATALAYARSPLGPGDPYLERYGLIGTYMRTTR